jgi:hypothetical protein
MQRILGETEPCLAADISKIGIAPSNPTCGSKKILSHRRVTPMRDRDGTKRHLTWQCMYAARFAVLAIVTVVVLLIAVLIEQYRMCKERGYSDCPRAGDNMWTHTRKN